MDLDVPASLRVEELEDELHLWVPVQRRPVPARLHWRVAGALVGLWVASTVSLAHGHLADSRSTWGLGVVGVVVALVGSIALVAWYQMPEVRLVLVPGLLMVGFCAMPAFGAFFGTFTVSLVPMLLLLLPGAALFVTVQGLTWAALEAERRELVEAG